MLHILSNYTTIFVHTDKPLYSYGSRDPRGDGSRCTEKTFIVFHRTCFHYRPLSDDSAITTCTFDNFTAASPACFATLANGRFWSRSVDPVCVTIR